MKPAASDHSWELTDSVYSATAAEAKKLKSNHFKFILSGEKKSFIEKLPKQFNRDFDYYLEVESNKLFRSVYKPVREMSDFKLIKLIKEELQVVLTNEEKYEKCVKSVKKQNKKR